MCTSPDLCRSRLVGTKTLPCKCCDGPSPCDAPGDVAALKLGTTISLGSLGNCCPVPYNCTSCYPYNCSDCLYLTGQQCPYNVPACGRYLCGGSHGSSDDLICSYNGAYVTLASWTYGGVTYNLNGTVTCTNSAGTCTCTGNVSKVTNPYCIGSEGTFLTGCGGQSYYCGSTCNHMALPIANWGGATTPVQVTWSNWGSQSGSDSKCDGSCKGLGTNQLQEVNPFP